MLELPGGQTLLYDAGSLGSPGTRKPDTIASYLWSRGITHVDGVVLSHADIDHYNALPGLIDRFSIGNSLRLAADVRSLGDAGTTNRTQLFERNARRSQRSATRSLVERSAKHRRHAQVAVEFSPPSPYGRAVGRDNANSSGATSPIRRLQVIFLPGDLESPGIEAVMAESRLGLRHPPGPTPR